MNKRTFAYTVLFILAAVLTFMATGYSDFRSGSGSNSPSDDQLMADEATETDSGTSKDSAVPEGKFLAPMDRFQERITKKSFGTYVEPGNSPVSPERFHSAVDFEIFPGEDNTEVPFKAICDGPLAIKRMAQGYGGIVAQYCDLRNSPVLVIYGHVQLSSVTFNLGDEIQMGQHLGILGQPGPDTDGERKHLHLGIRRGQELVILGYVQDETSLSDYVNPMEVLDDPN
jgi:hypothetical protein